MNKNSELIIQIKRLEAIEITSPCGNFAETLNKKRFKEILQALVEIDEVLDYEYKNSELQAELGNAHTILRLINNNI